MEQCFAQEGPRRVHTKLRETEVKTELIYSKVTIIWCESCDRLRVIE